MAASTIRIWTATGLLLAGACVTLEAGTVPRYELKPGQVLIYEEKEAFQEESQGSEYTTTWQLWVVGRNDDGSCRVVARTAMKAKNTDGSSAGSPSLPTYARFDLRPDGEVPFCPTLGTRIDPSKIFPRLPRDEKELASWESRTDRDETTVRYKPMAVTGPDDTATFDFEADRRGYAERIYEGSDHRTFRFERKRGLVVRGEMANGYGAHRKSKGKGTIELKSVSDMEATKMAAFADEMDRYFRAHQAYLVLYRRAETNGNEAESLLEKAHKILFEARDKVTLPEPIAALDGQLKNHEKFSNYQIDGAKRFAEIIGHPAPSWEIKDLDGRTHSLEKYRGKVLVLDFWYRGCGWCMRAMPQVKRVASHYRGRPVAVFGVNNDRNLHNAEFVVREMQLEYPVLRSEDLPAKYGVQSFPTLIIVDQQGKVAQIHVGYSPQLFEDVTAAVDRLLESK